MCKVYIIFNLYIYKVTLFIYCIYSKISIYIYYIYSIYNQLSMSQVNTTVFSCPVSVVQSSSVHS